MLGWLGLSDLTNFWFLVSDVGRMHKLGRIYRYRSHVDRSFRCRDRRESKTFELGFFEISPERVELRVPMSYGGWMHKRRPISGDLNHPPRWRRLGDTAGQIPRKWNISETAGPRRYEYRGILVLLVETNNKASILEPRRTRRFAVGNYYFVPREYGSVQVRRFPFFFAKFYF